MTDGARCRAFDPPELVRLPHRPLPEFRFVASDVILLLDLGCGPGHVAGYLHEQGVAVVGVDISSEMIRVSSQLNPALDFRAGDISALDFADGSLAGIVAFYSIVHFSTAELTVVFREMRRVLRPEPILLLSFHVGDEIIHVDDLFGAPVSLDFKLHHRAAVIRTLQASVFR